MCRGRPGTAYNRRTMNLNITPADLICRALIFLIAFPAHELAHAWAADRMGDPTPRAAGRLTLNPFKHLSLFAAVLFMTAGIGWASTPIEPANFGENWRRKLGLVSIAGPIANLALALLGTSLFYWLGWSPDVFLKNTNLPTLQYFLTQFVYFNLVLAVFNMLPIPPLDGARVFGAILTGRVQAAYDSLLPYGTYILLAVVFLLPRLGLDVIDMMYRYLIVPVFWFLMSGTF
jgi:Zn-dependent protease